MPASPVAPQSPPLPKRRLWGYRLLCVALAVLPFMVGELYLRVIHHVDSEDLSADPIFDTAGQTPLFVKSNDSTRFVIPKSRLNFFRPASFAADKPDNSRRIFVLGGSTVQGRPYETETAFAKWMELRLQSSDPSYDYEVVNCGGVSYASYRIAIILKEVLTHSPDAIVLYTGHNEFLEERSYHTMQFERDPLQRLAQRSFLVQSIRRQLRPQAIERQDLASELRTRLDLVDGMDRYVRDHQWRRNVVNHFHMTLERMIRMCEVAGVPMLLCVPTSDVVNTPPFKVEIAKLSETSLREFRSNLVIAQDGNADHARRIAACQACLQIDPQHAGVLYLSGILHWQNQRARQANLHLTAARDHDVCPLRATTPIIETILDVARDHAIVPIRCDLLFDQTDSLNRPLPDGIADPQRFVDHIHPTISGHQEIAVALSDCVIELFQIRVSESADEDFQKRLLEHLSALDETYYARGKQRLDGLRNWAAGRAGKWSVNTK